MPLKFLSRKPAICASLIAHDVEEFLEVARDAVADVLEIRADGLKLKHASEYAANIKRLLRNTRVQTGLPLILTVRMEKEGGVFTGSEAERAAAIRESMKLADAIDIELRMNERYREELMQEAKKNKIPVILSYHDLQGTPGEDAMLEILEEEANLGASVAKLAVKANSKKDVLKLLSATHQASQGLKTPICTISLGELGKISRIASLFFGSSLMYGYVTRETAPGQLKVQEIREFVEKFRI